VRYKGPRPDTSDGTIVDLTPDELRELFVFAEFSDDQLRWVLERAEAVVVEDHGLLLGYGESSVFHVLLEGRLEVRVMVAGRERVLAASEAPGAYGGGMGALEELGILTLEEHMPVSVHARPGSRLLRLDAESLKHMVTERYPIVRHFMAGLQALRRYEEMAGEHEKMASLGRVSAGIAHELHNPASAATRIAATIDDAIAELVAAVRRTSDLDAATLDRLRRSCAEQRPPPALGALERSDREERVAGALGSAGVSSPWKLAGDLVDSGCDAAWVQALPDELADVDLGRALQLLLAERRVDALQGDLRRSLERISEVIDAMKDFSHRDQAPDADVDVHEGLEATVTISAHQVPDGLRIVRDLDPDLPPVSGHAGELNQIWSNLLSNAIDASGAVGEITLRTRRADGHVVVTVADRGPGIPEDVRGRIFDPFFTTKDVGEGTGLGLDIVRRVVDAHGGSIDVESSPGGTSFHVRLPASR
jgi:signal transduction histidine kinase